MTYRIRNATSADSSAVSSLLQASFSQFIAPDWRPEAQALFMEDTQLGKLSSTIETATFASVAETGDEVVGFLLMPRPTLVGFLFVSAAWHRRGIAKNLWEDARAYVETAHPEVKTVELNSSPYAVEAYRALGFWPISEPYYHGGFHVTRMACWLPARSFSGDGNETK